MEVTAFLCPDMLKCFSWRDRSLASFGRMISGKFVKMRMQSCVKLRLQGSIKIEFRNEIGAKFHFSKFSELRLHCSSFRLEFHQEPGFTESRNSRGAFVERCSSLKFGEPGCLQQLQPTIPGEFCSCFPSPKLQSVLPALHVLPCLSPLSVESPSDCPDDSVSRSSLCSDVRTHCLFFRWVASSCAR